jgi:esterase/lipase superfamily enzyme
MRTERQALWSPAIGAAGDVLVYGHWGRPVIAFPAEGGRASDFAERGMLDAVRGLVDDGRVKIYCVDSFDAGSWSDTSLPLEERARHHERYESWLLEQVRPAVESDCGAGAQEILTVGCSLGAFHAVNLALRHPEQFPLAIGLSGNYDPSTWNAWGERGMSAYFHNPIDYVANLHGPDLARLRERVSILLVVGEGAWEVHPTQALPQTRRLAELLAAKGIRHELDVWGPDTPHDWSSWQRQLAHHLPRFC